jgi:hypothetical protein
MHAEGYCSPEARDPLDVEPALKRPIVPTAVLPSAPATSARIVAGAKPQPSGPVERESLLSAEARGADL